MKNRYLAAKLCPGLYLLCDVTKRRTFFASAETVGGRGYVLIPGMLGNFPSALPSGRGYHVIALNRKMKVTITCE